MNGVHDRRADTGALHELAALYAVNAPEPAEQAAFEHHLPGCPRCRTERADHAEVTAHRAEAVAQDPPPALRASVLEAIRSARPLPAVPDETPAGGGAAPADTGAIIRTVPAAECFSGSTTGRPGAGIVSLDARRRRRRGLRPATT